MSSCIRVCPNSVPLTVYSPTLSNAWNASRYIALYITMQYLLEWRRFKESTMVCNMDIVNGKRVSGLDNMFFDPFNSF